MGIKKQMRKKTIMLIVSVFIFMGFLVGCIQEKNKGNDTDSSPSSNILSDIVGTWKISKVDLTHSLHEITTLNFFSDMNFTTDKNISGRYTIVDLFYNSIHQYQTSTKLIILSTADQDYKDREFIVERNYIFYLSGIANVGDFNHPEAWQKQIILFEINTGDRAEFLKQ